MWNTVPRMWASSNFNKDSLKKEVVKNLLLKVQKRFPQSENLQKINIHSRDMLESIANLQDLKFTMYDFILSFKDVLVAQYWMPQVEIEVRY